MNDISKYICIFAMQSIIKLCEKVRNGFDSRPHYEAKVFFMVLDF